MKRRRKAVETWILRRIMRIPWTARVKNERVIEMVVVTRQLMVSVRRQLEFIGHILRQDSREGCVSQEE